MTKATVKNNIKYNENLVRSYQRSISEKKTQVSELTRLKGKITSYKSEFIRRERSRKNKVSAMSGKISLNIFKIYSFFIRSLFVISCLLRLNLAYSGSQYSPYSHPMPSAYTSSISVSVRPKSERL